MINYINNYRGKGYHIHFGSHKFKYFTNKKKALEYCAVLNKFIEREKDFLNTLLIETFFNYRLLYTTLKKIHYLHFNDKFEVVIKKLQNNDYPESSFYFHEIEIIYSFLENINRMILNVSKHINDYNVSHKVESLLFNLNYRYDLYSKQLMMYSNVKKYDNERMLKVV